MNALRAVIGAILLAGCMILAGGKVSAAELDAMEIFSETVYKTAGRDNRIFHQTVYFVLPNLTSKLDLICGVDRQKLSMAGDFGFRMTSHSGEYKKSEVPFYLAQNADSTTIYFQTDKKWKKITAPTAAAQFADVFAAPSAQQIQYQIDSVKEVAVLKETAAQRTLLVKFDGNKIADKIRAEINSNAASNPLLHYLDIGIRSADIWYTWTVNKNTWQTVTVSANLSGLVQSIAQAALNDTANPLPEPIRDMLENVAFYSEFKAYTTYLNPEAKSRLEIPKKVLKAKEVESFTADSRKK